jgi:hypothetical protein
MLVPQEFEVWTNLKQKLGIEENFKNHGGIKTGAVASIISLTPLEKGLSRACCPGKGFSARQIGLYVHSFSPLFMQDVFRDGHPAEAFSSFTQVETRLRTRAPPYKLSIVFHLSMDETIWVLNSTVGILNRT